MTELNENVPRSMGLQPIFDWNGDGYLADQLALVRELVATIRRRQR